MTTKQKQALESRMKSLAWRLTMMLIAFGIDGLIQYFTQVNIDPSIKIVAGLVLGEISKFINNELSKKK